ncbi:MAG: sulfatase family protein [Promethearchaeota archaeon]
MKRPNVVFLITHDQGVAGHPYDGAGPDAMAGVSTPNMDAVASRGVTLTNHFGTAPLCSPARGSLMTGLYPHENGLVGLTHRGFRYNEGQRTLLHVLKEMGGYRTVLLGLQHEGLDPRLLGYDDFHATSLITRCMWLVDDLEEVVDDLAGRGGPWWLSIGTEDVHRQWTHRADPVDTARVVVPPYLPDTPEVRQEVAELLGDVEAFDAFLGEVLRVLDERGLRESTLVVVTTDHGVALHRAKGTLYDPGIHTGMIWSWPGVVMEGEKVPALLSSVDFAPTICELCGVDDGGLFPGRSYAHLLTVGGDRSGSGTNTGTPWTAADEYIFAEKTYHDVYDPIRCVRTARYKYIRNFDDSPLAAVVSTDIRNGAAHEAWLRANPQAKNPRPPEEFYDLSIDPTEMHNLALEVPDHPELERLKATLEGWMEETGDRLRLGPYPAPPGAKVDDVEPLP